MKKKTEIGIMGRIELGRKKSLTLYNDGSALLSCSGNGLSVLVHLDSSDMDMIKDWQESKNLSLET